MTLSYASLEPLINLTFNSIRVFVVGPCLFRVHIIWAHASSQCRWTSRSSSIYRPEFDELPITHNNLGCLVFCRPSKKGGARNPKPYPIMQMEKGPAKNKKPILLCQALNERRFGEVTGTLRELCGIGGDREIGGVTLQCYGYCIQGNVY